MPTISDIPTPVREEILRRLARIEVEEGVRIVLAVESGSRAWGFPSPDSDYDARFIYVRPHADYLRLNPVRDVIERPILDDYDVNGWDVRKALLLMRKRNPVLLEWLNSPIIYRENTWVPDAIRELIGLFEGDDVAGHYLALMESQLKRHFSSNSEKRIKAYFYVIRPAMALRWVRQNNTPPPMDLPALMAGIELPADARAEIEELVAKKLETKEMGAMKPIQVIDELVLAERDHWAGKRQGSGTSAALDSATDALFLEIAERGAE